ncbi:MAG: hypothetical protein NVSMB1_25130 [Polyangiales bacterium]
MAQRLSLQLKKNAAELEAFVKWGRGSGRSMKGHGGTGTSRLQTQQHTLMLAGVLFELRCSQTQAKRAQTSLTEVTEVTEVTAVTAVTAAAESCEVEDSSADF